MPLQNYSLTARFNELERLLKNQEFEEATFYCADRRKELLEKNTHTSRVFATLFNEINLLLMSSGTAHIGARALQFIRKKIDEQEYNALFSPLLPGEGAFNDRQEIEKRPLTSLRKESGSLSQHSLDNPATNASLPNYSLTARFNKLEGFLRAQKFEEAQFYCGEKKRELLEKNTHASSHFAALFGELNRLLMSSNEERLAVFFLQIIRLQIEEEDYNTLFKPEMSLEERALRYRQEADACLGGQFPRDLFSEIQMNFEKIMQERA